MATRAVFLVLDVEGLLPVMTFAAEITLVDLAHFHLVRALGHLEYLVMASRALEPFAVHVRFVAEHDRCGILRRERQVSTADFLGEGSTDRNH